jgi:hypothetical protein
MTAMLRALRLPQIAAKTRRYFAATKTAPRPSQDSFINIFLSAMRRSGPLTAKYPAGACRVYGACVGQEQDAEWQEALRAG